MWRAWCRGGGQAPPHLWRRALSVVTNWLIHIGCAPLQVKARTSTVPFAAILDGRQKLPDDYWKEFARWPYVAVTCFTLGAYICHPLMQQASYSLHW